MVQGETVFKCDIYLEWSELADILQPLVIVEPDPPHDAATELGALSGHGSVLSFSNDLGGTWRLVRGNRLWGRDAVAPSLSLLAQPNVSCLSSS